MPSISRLLSSNPGRARPGLLAGLGSLLLIAIAVFWSQRTTGDLPGMTHLVVIEGMKFSPATIRMHSGDRIIFKNNDLVPHTITSKETGLFDSGSVKAGESWAVTLRTPGSFPFRCSFHPLMEGEITVAREKS